MKQTSLLMAGIVSAGQAAALEVPEQLPIEPENPPIKQSENDGKLANSVVTNWRMIAAPTAVPESSHHFDQVQGKSDRPNSKVESKAEIKRRHLLKSLGDKVISNSRSKSLSSSLSESYLSESLVELPLGENLHANIQKHNFLNNPQDNHQENISGESPFSNPHNQVNNNKINNKTNNYTSNSLSNSNSISPTSENILSENLSGNFQENDVREPAPTDATNGMEQVTSVSQLDDVKPTDWAFNALQNLVERYGCIAGYPDGSFRGNRAIARYEFAAGINACWDKINALIAENTENIVSEQDLLALQRLQSEFQAEIKDVQARVDNLEVRNAELKANQFSATTKLIGQAIVSVQGSNEPDMSLFPGDERKGETNLTMTSSAQLTLATSLTGRDLLLTGLAGGNLASSAPDLFTNMGRLAFESDTGNNDIYLNELSYRFPLSENFGVVVGTAGVNAVNTFRGINPLEGSGDGSISLFGQRNPILAIGGGRSGIGFDWQISDRVSLQGIYSTEIANFANDDANAGLIGGRYTLGTQVTLAPTDNLDVGIHYLFNHSPDDNLRTGVGDTQLISPLAPTNPFDTHAVGATVAWRVNQNLQFGGWGGWTFSNPVGLSGSVETTNWAVFAALPNLFRPGNLGGVIFGQPPKITSSTLPNGYNLPNFATPNFETGGGEGGRDDTSLHLEMFYRAQINDNLSLTPGVFLIFNPNHNSDNDTLVIGTLRATFRF